MSKSNAAFHFPPFHEKFPRHKRADRRVHRARMKKKAVERLTMYRWNMNYQPSPREIGKNASTHGRACSCMMCRPDPKVVALLKVPPMPEIITHKEMDQENLKDMADEFGIDKEDYARSTQNIVSSDSFSSV